MPSASGLSELLALSSQGIRPVHLQWTYTVDYGVFNRAEERAAKTKRTHADQVTLRELNDDSTAPPSRVLRCELFFRGPTEWKFSNESDEITVIQSLLGDESLVYSSEGPTLYTNRPEKWTKRKPVEQSYMIAPSFEKLLQQVPLLAPAFLARNCRFSSIASSQKLGRTAYSFVATRASDAEYPYFWEAIDRYEGVVDRDTGVLLRYAAVTHDGIAAVFDVIRIHENAPIPDAVLRTEVALGTTVMLSQQPPGQ